MARKGALASTVTTNVRLPPCHEIRDPAGQPRRARHAASAPLCERGGALEPPTGLRCHYSRPSRFGYVLALRHMRRRARGTLMAPKGTLAPTVVTNVRLPALP